MAIQENFQKPENLVYVTTPVRTGLARKIDAIAHHTAHANDEPYDPDGLCRRVLEKGIKKRASRLLVATGIAVLTTLIPAGEVSADGGQGVSKNQQPSAEIIVGTILGGAIGTVLGVAGGIYISHRLGLLPKNFSH